MLGPNSGSLFEDSYNKHSNFQKLGVLLERVPTMRMITFWNLFRAPNFEKCSAERLRVLPGPLIDTWAFQRDFFRGLGQP